ncbi:hypothetical protein P9265_06295 [Schinkia azotoformans]|uniref:hypothetical protein n=1 Tax=Schinkia azotoformans TaxID=1454 RepID=UPI002E1EF3C5|nr:hypothetical protein [Schinkia azotoformans]
MPLNKDFLMGFLSGTVVGAVGYRLYEQNSGQLQNLIQQAPQFNFPANKAEPTLEELALQKERLEDLIAEREASCK